MSMTKVIGLHAPTTRFGVVWAPTGTTKVIGVKPNGSTRFVVVFD